MEESEINKSISPKFTVLPSKFKIALSNILPINFRNRDLVSKIEVALLDDINYEKISLGSSPIFIDKVRPDYKELVVWLGDKFSIFIENSTGEKGTIGYRESTKLFLVYFYEIQRYELLWEKDLPIEYIEQNKPSIVKKYKDILPTVLKSKKERQKQVGNLPYIGKKKDGDFLLLGHGISRPEYSKIKSERLVSLKNCIRLLLGVDDLSLIVSKKRHLDLLEQYNDVFDGRRGFAWVYTGGVPGWVLWPENYEGTVRFREQWKDITSFVHEFLKRISNESKAGFIERFDYSTLSGDENFSIEDVDQGTHRCLFKTLPFLKWAKESGYAIPDELSLVENTDGTLHWADADPISEFKPDNIENSFELSGKDRQELGRLRKEKETMDLTVKAAIDVGKYIERAKMEGKLIVKREISDLINAIDLKVPDTRIDLIWRSIPEKIKSGPGRPKKA